jgi:cell division protein FtsI/penicillin-binding protein 2
LNVVFARLARKHLSVEQLTETAGAFGFGASVPFEVPNQPSTVALPEEPLEFARAAAGFWHTTLSPLAGTSIAQSIANQGVTFKPRIVDRVRDPGGKLLFEASQTPVTLRRSVKPDTAFELTKMMVQTTLNGSAHKAFYDAGGKPFLPNIVVAGKTGTLTREQENRFYTWFVGFAPADKPEVAISVLVVNTPTWLVKAPELARDVLRAYFAKQGRPGVTRP